MGMDPFWLATRYLCSSAMVKTFAKSAKYASSAARRSADGAPGAGGGAAGTADSARSSRHSASVASVPAPSFSMNRRRVMGLETAGTEQRREAMRMRTVLPGCRICFQARMIIPILVELKPERA